MNIAGFYEYEIFRTITIEDLVNRIIPHQSELKFHVFSPPGRCCVKCHSLPVI